MKAWLRGFYYSFPVQVLFLHFRKYQVLLVFWFILFSTVNSTFMKAYGADSLFLAPEYLGAVSTASFSIVGIAVGMFIMSWNITTFILFSRHFRFLAATTNPFLKYCINNSVIPFSFLLFYFFKAYRFAIDKELIPHTEILFLVGGFLSGFILILAVSFLYFFRADRSILRRMLPTIINPKEYLTSLHRAQAGTAEPTSLIQVEWYIDSPLAVRKTRNVSHYTEEFIEKMFKGHHIAAVLSVFVAFLFLIVIGNFLEFKLFQIPAAASITIFFAILIGVSGAFAYFLQSWSVPYLIGLVLVLNLFYRMSWIDPRNKAYGLNYTNEAERPRYNRATILSLCNPDSMAADRRNMLRILENWKSRQGEEKPLMVIINTSGGGQRSATFTMNALQRLDSATHGALMKKTVLITGASGGMLGAAYFRELYLHKLRGEPIRLQDHKYTDNIAGDLLNPLFSSFVDRDLIAPAQKFYVGPYHYVKDRGYAFEQELSDNTGGILNKQLRDYTRDEQEARIPMIFFNSVVTRDGRKMVISTQPVRFMMQPREDTSRIPYMDPDAIDFATYFRRQNPGNLRILTALRMNATFPVVLPNVWLPSDPVIDVMDAGIRDNYGTETALRFLENFDDWIRENTRGVLVLQLRDRVSGGWDYPYQSNDITDHITKPFLLLQHNWYKMMEFSQNDMLGYYAENPVHQVRRITFEYRSESAESKAALNFHLTQGEKADIIHSLDNEVNRRNLQQVADIFVGSEPLLRGGR
ncbi:MAG TPA: patatin-like phospholipase family protein [Chitinophagaceae bacterium]|nr:patatin-like phospholipase family protein [Chitinophagaceae bacterium]